MSKADLWIACTLLGVALGLMAGGCEGTDVPGAQRVAESPFVAPATRPQEREQAVVRVAGHGDIRIELLADLAPETVQNFKKLAAEGFYDGTTFHRVIPDFMVQGGDPNTRDRDPRNDGRGGPGYHIGDEHSDTAHVRGVVSMANYGRPDSSGSQFFIVIDNASHLDGQYNTFGLVVDGMDVVESIAATPRDLYGRHGPVDRPLEDVVVESVRVEPPGSHAASAAPTDESA